MKLFELWFPKIKLNQTFWKHEISTSSWNHKWITISLRSQKASGPCEIIKATVGNYSNKECIALKLSSSQLTKYDKQIQKVNRKIIWVNYSNKGSHNLKRKGILRKTFSKWWPPSPRLVFVKSVFRFFRPFFRVNFF